MEIDRRRPVLVLHAMNEALLLSPTCSLCFGSGKAHGVNLLLFPVLFSTAAAGDAGYEASAGAVGAPEEVGAAPAGAGAGEAAPRAETAAAEKQRERERE